jgi:hypothetical protein
MPSNGVEQSTLPSPHSREDSEDVEADADAEVEDGEDSDYEDDDNMAFAQLEGFFADSATPDEVEYEPSVPVVYPRQRFVGARNVATIKDGQCTS